MCGGQHLSPMKKTICEKTKYSYERAHHVRELVYNQGRKKRLRIYKCDICFMYHLTSNMNDYLDSTTYRAKRKEKRL